MNFIDRQQEMRRLDDAQSRSRAFVALWGRRRVGKTRLLTEWVQCNDGIYTVADQSAPAVQRRYLASALATRLPGFDEVEYPDWQTMLRRLDRDSRVHGWRGPLILDEFPYVVTAQPDILSVLQNWLDSPTRNVGLVICGSSMRMMKGVVLDSTAPLYGRSTESFAIGPLRPGFLPEVFPTASPRELVSQYAVWGGIPRYCELAEPYADNLPFAVDALILDPMGPLHNEPDRLLRAETPPATALRPLLDVIGNGAHRVSEIAGRLGRQASTLAGPLSVLNDMGLIRRETPFGSDPRTGKRSLYQIADPFLRFWFRVVAPNRSLLAQAPRETRLKLWHRYRVSLEAYAWEELCRMAVPTLHQAVPAVAEHGPFGLAQRYWRGNDPELDVVARAVDRPDVLVGEVKWSVPGRQHGARPLRIGSLPIGDAPIRAFTFAPDASPDRSDVVDARSVFESLR